MPEHPSILLEIQVGGQPAASDPSKDRARNAGSSGSLVTTTIDTELMP